MCEAENKRSSTWTWSLGDFGAGLGVAAIILAAGYAGCEDSTLRARGKLIAACHKAMADGRPIPEMCTAAVK
jgi:hypothetical protein